MKIKHYFFFIVILFLSSCEIAKRSKTNVLESIRQKGTLVVLTRNTSTTYYEGQEGLLGYEHDLIVAFSKHLGVKIQFKVLDSVSDVLSEIKKGEGDIAAAGLTRTDQREEIFLFGPDYFLVQQQVVCRRGNLIPKSIEDLPNFQISIIKDSSYHERLMELQQDLPNLKWDIVSDISTEQLLEKVWKNEVECVVADSNIVAINRRYYPELIVAFPISETQSLAWIVRGHGDDLKTELEKWIQLPETEQQLTALKERYYSFLSIFDYVNIRAFHKKIKTHLPKYLPVFKKAGKKYDIPWTFLAAQAYQESHWNPRARSPTGVRGMMMLTLNTARQVGIKNRLNPVQSIMGGAKYFSQLLKRIPQQIKEQDQYWYALAAYNVGLGHIQDARILAKRQNKDPNQWYTFKEVLPFLSSRKYYRTLKHGYARGSEPVRYVQRVREFHEILKSYNKDELF